MLITGKHSSERMALILMFSFMMNLVAYSKKKNFHASFFTKMNEFFNTMTCHYSFASLFRIVFEGLYKINRFSASYSFFVLCFK